MKMQTVLKAMWATILVAVMAVPSQAGEWVLDHYDYRIASQGIDYSRDGNQRSYQPNYHNSPNLDEGEEPTLPAWQQRAGDSGSGLSAWARNGTIPALSVTHKLWMTPIFKWIGDDEPTRKFWVRELGWLNVYRRHTIEGGNGNRNYPYTQAEPYQGQILQITKADNGFKDQLPTGGEHGSVHWAGDEETWSALDNVVARWHLIQYDSGGAREHPGRTRLLQATIKLPAQACGSQRQSFSVGIRTWYQAEVCQFSLGISTDQIADSSTHPRDRKLEAWASKNWTNQHSDNPEDPIEFFWDGSAIYSADLSQNLKQTLGNQTSEWKVEDAGNATANVITPPQLLPKNPSDWRNALNLTWEPWDTQVINEGTIAPSTPVKNFHHELTQRGQPTTSEKWPKKTVTRVTVQGDNPENGGRLTAKAKIEWDQKPMTRVRTETYVVVYDYDAGGIPKEYPSLEAALIGSPEEQQIDQYISQIRSAYKETLETGGQAVETALELQMAVGSWYVPDETDAALFVVGGVAKKVFKVGRGAAKFTAIVSAVRSKLIARIDLIHDAIKARTGHENVVVEVRQRLIAEVRVGKVPHDGIRSRDLPSTDARHIQDREGVIADDLVSIKSSESQCFAAGTLVLLPNGTRKPIERIREGDFVLSKDQVTGEILAKKVTHTFVRYASTTVLLSLGAEIIETTEEHPFYVQGRGFVAAGSLGIGNTIVTRAGPHLTLASVNRGGAKTVYNIEVEDFHTYFVGSSALWVHNACSGTLRTNLEATVGDGMQAHHLIPGALENDPFVRRAREAGWSIDGSNNGIMLPGSNSLSHELNLPRHLGSHPEYNRQVGIQLNRLQQQADAEDWSDIECARRLNLLAAHLSESLRRMGGGEQNARWIRVNDLNF